MQMQTCKYNAVLYLFQYMLVYFYSFSLHEFRMNWKKNKAVNGSQDITFIIYKGYAIECSNYRTTALISHTSKVMLKIRQAKLQQYVNCELPDCQAGFRKGRGTRDQIASIQWIIIKARFPEKHLLLLH